MDRQTMQVSLQSEKDTAALAKRFADVLKAGDVVLLQGEIGAGKSTFARALIRHRLGEHTEVPSPTFTLVQIYDDRGCEIWHCDLYRTSHVDEVFELGLEDAFDTAICLIEWPERLGDLTPDRAIHIHFSSGLSEHRAEISGTLDQLQSLGLIDAN